MWSPVNTKIRKVFTREHLNAALKSTPLAKRVQRTASSVNNALVFALEESVYLFVRSYFLRTAGRASVKSEATMWNPFCL